MYWDEKLSHWLTKCRRQDISMWSGIQVEYRVVCISIDYPQDPFREMQEIFPAPKKCSFCVDSTSYRQYRTSAPSQSRCSWASGSNISNPSPAFGEFDWQASHILHHSTLTSPNTLVIDSFIRLVLDK